MNIAPQRAAEEAGRICPLDYAYAPGVFARTADFSAETLYVVGGLYGNFAALETIKAMARAERAEIERGTAPYRALRGNVETEIARAGDIGAGCGCAYPESVSGDVVARSNEIVTLLQKAMPVDARERLAQLPMHLVAKVGGLRVGIVHGDAAALAGWRFSQDELDNPKRRDWLADIQDAAKVDVFACTHTCLAALRDFALPGGRLTIVNNGAAGMPNFSATQSGVITRIAKTPSPHKPLYGIERDGMHIDALAVDYDSDAFLARFLKRWPPGSPAYESYYSRIANGPDYRLRQAAPTNSR